MQKYFYIYTAILSLFLVSVTECFAAKRVPLLQKGCGNVKNILRLSEQINNKGAFINSANYQLNSKVLCLAREYSRTKKDAHAEAVIRILLRYARVVNAWPLIDRKGRVDRKPSFLYWGLGGLWEGRGVYRDLIMSANLARAYQMVAGSRAVSKIGEQQGIDAHWVIRERLLRYLVDYNLRFGRKGHLGTLTKDAEFPFMNMDPFRIRQLAVFGKTVDPAYIHIAVYLIRKFLTVGFFRDGFWHEGTLSYHLQVIDGLEGAVQDLKGYSDPIGYRFITYRSLFGDLYNGTPGNFSNLDLMSGKVGVLLQKSKEASFPFLLPNGQYLAKNDTHTGLAGDPEKSLQRSVCLFALRHCALVLNHKGSRSIVHLGFDGTNGHEHYDALHFDYWASDMLLVSDGNYGGKSARKWNRSTSSHNTVVVDGRDQDNRFSDREKLSGLDLIDSLGHYVWQGYGYGDTNNQGDLLAADLSGGPIQYVIADATRAYDSNIGISRYERTLILVKGETGGSYLIDVFRVRGGLQHDWMMHGNLALKYDLKTNLAEQKNSGFIGQHLRARVAMKSSADWISAVIYAGGKKLVTHHLQNAPGMVILAEGEAQKRKGKASFLGVRQDGPDSVFVKVHVPEGIDGRIVKSVKRVSEDNGIVRLKIELSSGRIDDVVIHPFAVAQTVGQNLSKTPLIEHTARKNDGSCLWKYEGDRPGDMRSWHIGNMKIVRRQEGGHANGFRLESGQINTKHPADLLHIQLPNGVVESFGIVKVTSINQNEVFIEIEGDPGLRVERHSTSMVNVWLVKHLYFPSRGYVGPLKYRTTSNQIKYTGCLDSNG